jgi:hypothetical protein
MKCIRGIDAQPVLEAYANLLPCATRQIKARKWLPDDRCHVS